MNERVDFNEKLQLDLIEQFRDKPNIKVLAEALARQLQDVFTFYEQLRTERNINTAVGKQLDGVGEIVGLTRMEAGLLGGDPIPFEVIDDERYRKYLIFKILKNTSHTTYPDIIKAFKMFWDRPLYYREDPEQPATMILDTGVMQGAVDTTPLFDTPLIRAAGVTLKVYSTTETEMETDTVRIASGLGYALTITKIPELERNYQFTGRVRIASAMVQDTQSLVPGVADPELIFSSRVTVDGTMLGSIARSGFSDIEDPQIDYGAEVAPGSVVHSVMETPIGDPTLQTTQK